MDGNENGTSRFILMACLVAAAITVLVSWAARLPAAGENLPAGQPLDPSAVIGDPPFPIIPPDATKITIGLPDIEGLAQINGDVGSVPGDSTVIVINLSTMNAITTTATSSGVFSTTLFAPPGSSLLVKYDIDGGLASQFWADASQGGADTTSSVINALPGTIIPVGEAPLDSGSYHVAGFFGPWAGWWISGTIAGPAGNGDFDVSVGDVLTLDGSVRITSPALDCQGVPPFAPAYDLKLRYFFDAAGQSYPWGAGFVSHISTPTGLPIEHEADGERVAVASGAVNNLACLSQHTAGGLISTTFQVPLDFPDGLFRLEIEMHPNGVPLDPEVPSVFIWYHQWPIAYLPLLTVGSPAQPRIPWTLMADYLSNGHRGANALENEGRGMMVTRIIIPPEVTVLPMLDERSGEPLTYRLEPGSPWMANTDRRQPNPPAVLLRYPSGQLTIEVHKPDGSLETLGPATIQQSSVRTPTTPGGSLIDEGTGHAGDIFHLYTGDEAFSYHFDQYGMHLLTVSGSVEDIYGNSFAIEGSYQVMIARILDLDPAQLPTMPYMQGDAFAPGLHVFPPVPADVSVRLTHLPNSNPDQAFVTTLTGQANRFGYFQPAPGTELRFDSPGEFRVDINATYQDADGTLWAGYLTWGSVVEGQNALIEAHGRRGLDFEGDDVENTPIWFFVNNLEPEFLGKEMYYPYYSGDVHWGDETVGVQPGDSIHTSVTVRDLTGPAETIYNVIRAHFPRARNHYRWPPVDYSLDGLNARLGIGEAPLFMTTDGGMDPAVSPWDIDLWAYSYGTSERPDVHVREIIAEDNIGTAYWRFNDTYGYQIGEPADGDQPGDLKWEFGGVVFRALNEGINEYSIYSSLWVLLPHNDPLSARVTPPFQDATGAGPNGGPIMTLLGQDVDMLFLPKAVRPGDVLEVGDTISFSGHVGPPLNSRVEVTITSPSGQTYADVWQANKIGWIYDPQFDFAAEEPGRWTVDVFVEHDQPYIGNGVIPQSHNTGSVLGTSGQYAFYVVEPGSPRLVILDPQPGFITWPNQAIEPITFTGLAPPGTTTVYYTVHDKGVVMGQGAVQPDISGHFSIVYDAVTLHDDFSMLSLTAHEGRWPGLADEVAINVLAVGGEQPQGATITLIGEEIFIGNSIHQSMIPLILNPNGG